MNSSINTNSYIAIIADIKGSKKLNNRLLIQERLKSVLQNINTKYVNIIASNFTITLGDEFQGILNDGAHVMDILFEIEKAMYPIQLRYGVGVGNITTHINRALSIGADGPAYYCARAAIESVKENEKKRKTAKSDIHIIFEEGDVMVSNLLNTIFSLLTVIKCSWTERQREIIWDMLEHDDGQINTAIRFHVQQPAIQKALASGDFYTYKEAIDSIKGVLSEIRRQYV